jgi:hypothetical protein
VARRYDVLEDGGGAVGVSGGGTTVGVCVGLSVGVCVGLSVGLCVGLSVGLCVGVTTAVGALVTITVVVLLELHPVIAAAATAAPQPITQIIFALLISSPPGVYDSCDLPPHSSFRQVLLLERCLLNPVARPGWIQCRPDPDTWPHPRRMRATPGMKGGMPVAPGRREYCLAREEAAELPSDPWC